MKFFNKKQVNKILDELKEYYGIKELKIDYAFFQNNKNKIYLISKDIKNIDAKDLRINGFGLYFLNISKGLRLSIEGSQIVGKKATKNIHEINDEELKEWLKGYDLDCKDIYGYKLIKNSNDFYGVGYAKENKIKNFVPKYRRIKNV
jgi:NOL1/NOP2/fmu family ribosome biogenesis protein